jgi:hypothetical protein
MRRQPLPDLARATPGAHASRRSVVSHVARDRKIAVNRDVPAEQAARGAIATGDGAELLPKREFLRARYAPAESEQDEHSEKPQYGTCKTAAPEEW